MSDRQSDLHTPSKAIDAQLDRFKQQAVTIVIITLMLSVAIYLVLLQVFP